MIDGKVDWDTLAICSPCQAYRADTDTQHSPSVERPYMLPWGRYGRCWCKMSLLLFPSLYSSVVALVSFLWYVGYPVKSASGALPLVPIPTPSQWGTPELSRSGYITLRRRGRFICRREVDCCRRREMARWWYTLGMMLLGLQHMRLRRI